MKPGFTSPSEQSEKRPLWTLLLVLSLLILAGQLQLSDPIFDERANGPFRTIQLTIQISPAIPLICVLVSFLCGRAIAPAVIRPMAGIAFLTGALLTLVNAALSSSGSFQLSIIHGVSLSCAATAGLLILSFGRLNTNEIRFAWSGLIISSVVALWSLIAVPVILIQANNIARENPYCLARHDRSAQTSSATDLRGLSFYTTATGFKSTSNWYFHGVLIVETESGLQYFNWSPRYFRFDRIEHPDRFIVPLRGLCMPSA